MTIRNKDGSVFRLPGSNPLMENQALSSWGKVSLHNMKWKSTVSPDTSDKSYYTMLATGTGIHPTSIMDDPLEEQVEATPKQINPHGLIKVLCLPAILEKRFDELYGDTYVDVKYGDKFRFEAVLVEESDFIIKMWTNKEIQPQSVLYPQVGEKRWWKVSASEPYENGWMLTAMISNMTPDFS